MTTSKSRGLWIAGNWKMNLTLTEAKHFFETFQPLLQSLDFQTHLHLWLLPPATHLKTLQDLVTPQVTLAAQNAHAEHSGAFTGEISGPMLMDLNISHVLLGHSERRQHFHETNDVLRQKFHQLFAQGFQIMLCIGETHEQRQTDQTFSVLETQLESILTQLPPPIHHPPFLIAYEPIWGIGTGLHASPEQITTVHTFLRQKLSELVGASMAYKIPLLYGGSVQPQNAPSLLSAPEVDGLLVGGASLKPHDFFAILSTAAQQSF